MAILRIDNVSKRFAGLMALTEVHFAIQAGSIK
ncbi:MAG: ABC transporter ATP-binding protein, partial [Deltaproteobacteria bacterium]|nr:ABC transporter ATP-binding protein [Deltaproteobacteria bacterium]